MKSATGTDCLLLIVARAPIPGCTKTRLGQSIGMERAALLHRAFLTDLAERFAPPVANGAPGFDFGWAYAPAEYDFRALMRELDPMTGLRPVQYVPQSEGDFAERLTNLFHWSANKGYLRTLILASDSPHLGAEVIPSGFDLLAGHDVVLGRVADGGYYVIGMRGVHDVISPSVMSTSDAASDPIAGAKALGLRVGELPATFDVDTEADLRALITLLEEDPTAAPATGAALSRMGMVAVRS